MKSALRLLLLILCVLILGVAAPLAAEPLPLKRVVELALAHSATAAASAADEQRAFASYHEARDQYLPQLAVGSGVGKTWGYPLTLESSAPSIVNINAQSALINPALREFVRASRTEWQATTVQAKDQRNQLIQDVVLSYAELNKWEILLGHLQEEQSDAAKMEKTVEERVQAGVDSAQAKDQARLNSARVRLRLAEAQGAIDVLRNRLSQMTGLPANSIETVTASIPPLPEIRQEDSLAAKAVQSSPAVQAAEFHAQADVFRARGEHRALWPTLDFAAQYALLATFYNYQHFFVPGSFQTNNGILGVVVRFPFLNPSQHARAEAADAEALRARQQVVTTKNQLSEETLRAQRAVEQLAAAQQVAELEYEIAHSNLEAMQTRANSSNATVHDVENARTQSDDRYDALQDANFELERGRINLLRATGELESWVNSGQ